MTRYAPPSSEELIAAADRLGVADAAAMFARYGAALEFAYRCVDALDEYLPAPDPRARTFTRPPPEENPLPGHAAFTLSIAGWGWHSEVAIHVLRLALSGALDPIRGSS
jgi:hypothetical protein